MKFAMSATNALQLYDFTCQHHQCKLGDVDRPDVRWGIDYQKNDALERGQLRLCSLPGAQLLAGRRPRCQAQPRWLICARSAGLLAAIHVAPPVIWLSLFTARLSCIAQTPELIDVGSRRWRSNQDCVANLLRHETTSVHERGALTHRVRSLAAPLPLRLPSITTTCGCDTWDGVSVVFSCRRDIPSNRAFSSIASVRWKISPSTTALLLSLRRLA
jgi:hypothetical protein